MEDVGLRPALPAEASSISALAMRSKAHWGYDDAFLTACEPDLTIDPAWCDGVRLLVAVRGGELLGYCRVSGVAPNGELDGLFVDPSAIGTGVGGELLRAAAMVARSLEMTRLGIDSDPGAEEFYLHAGALRVGESPSTVIPGRMLPRLELTLSATVPARECKQRTC